MLYRDTSATFEKSGAWIFARYRFVSGKLAAPRSLSAAAYARLVSDASAQPQAVLEDPERKRRWWFFDGEAYWEDQGFDAIARALGLRSEQAAEHLIRKLNARLRYHFMLASPTRKASGA